MSEAAVQVNFGKPIALFPLGCVSLLPQQVIPLRIFEPHYRAMTKDALDGSGLIAMAVYDLRPAEGPDQRARKHRPKPDQSLPKSIRPAVCIGRIVQHERTEDGGYALLMQGVCRARILQEILGASDAPYRAAILEPVGLRTGGELSEDTAFGGTLDRARDTIMQMLEAGPLQRLSSAGAVLEFLRQEEAPSSAILEILAATLVLRPAVRYKILAEGDASKRAKFLLTELGDMAKLVRSAERQHPELWPKGTSWN